jgi:hypothetical protein
MNWIRSFSIIVLALAPLLAGCTGSLSIWGVNVPLPGDEGDDDDSSPPQLDFSEYDGSEWITIDWSQQMEEQGRVDCVELYRVFGDNSTVDDFNLCDDCDEIWNVTLAADDNDLPCLTGGTGLDVPATYNRKVGIDFDNSMDFDYYRNLDDQDDVLEQIGIGAIDGVEYTWSGLDGFIEEHPQVGFDVYFKGEGSF